MSLTRLIYYSAIIGGWSAFVGWLIAEFLVGWWVGAQDPFLAFVMNTLMAALVATAICGGLSRVAGLANFRWGDAIKHLGPSLLVGLIGGLVGGLLGNLLFSLFGSQQLFPRMIGRALGWTLMGLGVGVAEGLYERNWSKIRNGLIGGALGGFLGGLLFDPIGLMVGGGASSRAVGFVILGICIGLFIGLVQVVLKQAWLTVEQGFRPGRQLILSQQVTTMGTSERASLIFIAYGAKGVEPIHLQIVRQPDGRYAIADNRSRSGTFVNGQPLPGPAWLRDGDLIQFGVNAVRFNEKVRHVTGVPAAPQPAPAARPASAPQVHVTPAQPVPVARPAPQQAAGAVRPGPPQGAPVIPIPVAPTAPHPVPRPAQPTPIAAVPPPPAPPRAAPAAPAAPQQPVAGLCPTCERRAVGIPGRRRCENCGRVF